MPYIATNATHKLLKLKKRVRAVAGGTSAGKTIAILEIIIDDAQSDTKPTLTSIVAESFPHLRKGAMRDFKNIMMEHGYFNDKSWNKSEYIYTFDNGSQIEFFSADQPSKVRGPRRDRLFVNEGNNIAKESWDQLLLRTRQYAFIDWNPVSDFYMYEDYHLSDEPKPISADPDCDFVILTYKDNEALDDTIVNEIEKRKSNKQWFRVYGEGKRGEVEGKIYKDWAIIDSVPHEARLVARGLDFGFSNDPAVLVSVYYYNGGFIIDEEFYRKGMHNSDIANFINNLKDPQILVTADAAEPKSIDELRMYGVNVIGSMKGAGAKTRRIDYVQEQKISVTKRSLNIIKSYRNYMWKVDKEGNILNEPDHFWSDGMDAVGYGIESQRPRLLDEDENETYTSGDITSLWAS